MKRYLFTRECGAGLGHLARYQQLIEARCLWSQHQENANADRHQRSERNAQHDGLRDTDVLDRITLRGIGFPGHCLNYLSGGVRQVACRSDHWRYLPRAICRCAYRDRFLVALASMDEPILRRPVWLHRLE